MLLQLNITYVAQRWGAQISSLIFFSFKQGSQSAIRFHKALSRHNCCRGKLWVLHILSVCLCSCLIYLARKEHEPCYIVIYDLSDSTVFSDVIS